MALRATIDLSCGWCGHRWTAWNVGTVDEPVFPDAEKCPECGDLDPSTEGLVVRDTRTQGL